MSDAYLAALQEDVRLAKEEWASFIATQVAPRTHIMVQGNKAANLLRFYEN
ncbi:cysteine synthase [Acetobacter orientalis]|uniref:Cysteine synthase n=1 Tax=Acetobacter orientalis TaxID=146474 RepID=A0A2Z5ZKC9_9PROT|nr:cysteine synthase [Acetobacter orientalis]